MDLKLCEKCKKMFYDVSESLLCPRCRGKLEIKYQETVEYISENCTKDIEEVAEACRVEIAQIQEWIREKKLKLPEPSPIRIPCEHCGEKIQSGRLCKACERNRVEIANSLSLAFRESRLEVSENSRGGVRHTKSKMHFLDDKHGI